MKIENIDNSILCEYGCNRVAKFKFKNKKLCCENNTSKCIHIINAISLSLKQREQVHEYKFRKATTSNCQTCAREIDKRQFIKHIQKCTTFICMQCNNKYFGTNKAIKNGLYKSKFCSRICKDIFGKTLETKQKISLSISNLILTTDCYKLRSKTYKIWCPYMNKEVFLIGTYELVYAIYLNENKILWDKQRLNYIKNNTKHYYHSDFHLIKDDIHIEIKGFFSEDDKAKMKLVKECNLDKTIKVLLTDDIKALGIKIIGGRKSLDDEVLLSRHLHTKQK